ncbi:GNAT family N-acetyltransferase [uncultured Sneathiella sp.]|jgi:GNAT superfamily N-acetyltransferase|uniref:GNAT family N-acetyltransferase n=1 Tax=uncultured Sneathiella sp. TaxID=879315 RepID=UPI0030DC4CE7|tara:strand:- start:441 stop:989 length:549 start_codon:yes stop_codon:yes gene_type:complete
MTEPLNAAGLKSLPGYIPPLCRELRPAEHGLLLPHLQRLGPDSLRLRFGSPVSLHTVTHYCRNEGRPLPIICGAFLGFDLRGVVELRFASGVSPTEAELAISVEDDWQQIGIGTELMTLALRCARDSHIDALAVNFVPNNMAIRRLAQKFGAGFSHQAGLVKGVFPLIKPGYAVIAGSKRPQ